MRILNTCCYNCGKQAHGDMAGWGKIVIRESHLWDKVGIYVVCPNCVPLFRDLITETF